ncbi:MAG: ATP-dependent protease [Isosphaeraceae bacterium]|jgi:Lon protease-like protein|nr:MAG: ATP-dependent protease [Isosphaeraceae bacterium]
MVPQDDLHDFEGIVRLFPLRGVIHFPHVILPLHIFEPRYRQMTEHALASDLRIGMIQSRPSLELTYPDHPPLVEVGCLGRIIRHERLPDGRFNFLLLGLRRFRIIRELDAPTLYRQAQVELIDEPDPGPEALLLSQSLADEVERIIPNDAEWRTLLRGRVPLNVLTDLIAHAFPFPAEIKQHLLEEPHPARRAARLIELLKPITPSSRPGVAPEPRPPSGFSLN